MGRFFVFAVLLILILLLLLPVLLAADPGQLRVLAQNTDGFAAVGACGDRYTVQPGDYLYAVAVRCGVSYSALRAANPQISIPALIYPGQVVNIPADGGIPVTGAPVYTVIAGDTLGEIAARYGTSVQAILNANPQITDADWIYPGQVIVLADDNGIPVTGGRRYTVVYGDRLWIIAARYNTSVQAILNANPQITDADWIYPGQVIVIP